MAQYLYELEVRLVRKSDNAVIFQDGYQEGGESDDDAKRIMEVYLSKFGRIVAMRRAEKKDPQ